MEMTWWPHCGPVNRGSYVNSLVLTDIASGWTEAAPIVVRRGQPGSGNARAHRVGLTLRPAGGGRDNGTEFRERQADRILPESWDRLTRSRPYRKNDQAWIEQKNGAIVRKMLGYRPASRV